MIRIYPYRETQTICIERYKNNGQPGIRFFVTENDQKKWPEIIPTFFMNDELANALFRAMFYFKGTGLEDLYIDDFSGNIEAMIAAVRGKGEAVKP